jgi:hypothetical protein
MRERTGRMLNGTTAIGTTVAPPTGPVPTVRTGRQAPRGTTAGPARKTERDLRDERETAWVRDQVERDVEAAGSPVGVVNVKAAYNGWTVRLMQWLPHGVGGEVDHDLTFNRTGYGDDHKEPRLRRFVTQRMAKVLRRQVEAMERLGFPRALDAAEIDLTRFRIEAPLVAMMRAAFGKDAGAKLRAAMATNQSVLGRSYERDYEDALRGVAVKDVTIQYGRGRIQGAFETTVDGVTLRWSKGGLSMFGASIPDSLVGALTGLKLGQVVEHPLFDPDLKVTSSSNARRQGRDGVALTVSGMMQEVPEDW